MKKLFSILVAAVMTFTLSAGAFAATPGTIYNADIKNFQAALTNNAAKSLILQDKKAITVEKLTDIAATPDSEIKIYLTDTMFVDNQGTKINADITAPKHISRSQVSKARIALRRATSRGSKAFSSVGLAYDKVGSYISIKFVDPFVSVDDIDFSTTLYLTVNGTRKKGTEITVSGTMAADVVEVYSDDDYVDLSEGRVAEAVERISKIEVDTGNELTIFTTMTRGKKYYATSSTDLTNADSRVMDNYPGIAEIYTLKTVNLTASNKTVSIYTGNKMHAYGADGVYLGTTDKLLNYSTKYYVSDIKYGSIKVK